MVPSAIANVSKTQYSIRNNSANSVRVAGRDYLGKVQMLNGNICWQVSVNPVGWAGTRVANVARTYSNYRPLRFVVHYMTNVATTQAGCLYFGTVWGDSVVDPVNPAGLLTSDGGTQFSVWKNQTCPISFRNLPQRAFYTEDTHGTDSEPLTAVMTCQDPSNGLVAIAVGSVFVEYEYEFANAYMLPEYPSLLEGIQPFTVKAGAAGAPLVVETTTEATSAKPLRWLKAVKDVLSSGHKIIEAGKPYWTIATGVLNQYFLSETAEGTPLLLGSGVSLSNDIANNGAFFWQTAERQRL